MAGPASVLYIVYKGFTKDLQHGAGLAASVPLFYAAFGCFALLPGSSEKIPRKTFLFFQQIGCTGTRSGSNNSQYAAACCLSAASISG